MNYLFMALILCTVVCWSVLGIKMTFYWGNPKNVKQLILLSLIVGPFVSIFLISFYIKELDIHLKIKNYYDKLK